MMTRSLCLHRPDTTRGESKVEGDVSMAVQETWLLSEFCDKGNLDRAVSGGRFHDKATGAPEMVRTLRHDILHMGGRHAKCWRSWPVLQLCRP